MNTAPQLTTPKLPEPGAGWDSSALSNLDPEMMQQFTQALQRLPKGQLQRLQVIMQKAMSGKDVSSEAAELEKSLPADFQQIMQAFSLSAASRMETLNQVAPMNVETAEMTEEQARDLVARAAVEGTISKEQADTLLKGVDMSSHEVLPVQLASDVSEGQQSSSKLSKIWKTLAGKRET